ncbi:MAG: ABC transporter ATP-binding protein [Candidatus Undinarchaeales archaeon]|nr:ABC transporter ATP-binding protein [Candidatus Undinarchaeales archaeon]
MMVSEPVIDVSGLGKRFRLTHERRATFKDHLISLIRGETYSYEEFWALKDVSFSLELGESLGLIGPNGSGKTTLLSILANVMRPDRGTVDIRGRIASFLGLGIGFEGELTARENVYLYGSIMGLKRKDLDAKQDEIFAFAELERFRDMRLNNFSSGMYMRLAFSTAIMVDPDIFLIDEALAVGDMAFQKKCKERIKQFKEEGRTIVFVSHDLKAVKDICERSILLYDGKVLSVGESEKVITDYHLEYAKRNPPSPK